MSQQIPLLPLVLAAGLALAGCSGPTRAENPESARPVPEQSSPAAPPSTPQPDEDTAETAGPEDTEGPEDSGDSGNSGGDLPGTPVPAPTPPPMPGAMPYQNFSYDEAYAAWQEGMPYYDAFCIHYEPTTPAGVSQCEGIEKGTVDSITGEYIGG